MNIFFVYILIFSISLSTFLKSEDECEQVVSRSFMTTRPASYHQAIHQLLWHNVNYTGKGDMMANSNLTLIYQKSLPQNQTARYFLLNGKKDILISGDNNTQDTYSRDVRAEWLGLPADFRGRMSLTPKQQQLGFWFEYNQQLKRFISYKFFENSWVSVRLPVIFVDNSLNPSYETEKNSSTLSLARALDNPSWCFGKISCKERSKVALAEIRISLGKTFIDEDYFQLGYETTMVIPTAQKQNPEYLFSPVVGINGHAAFGNKLTFQVLLNRNPEHAAWTFFFNLEALLLIANRQKRTFDLRGEPNPDIQLRHKQWSRFLMFTQQDGTIAPGVNVLTRDVVVNPYTLVDLCAGWRMRTKKFEFELGYNLWGHGKEKLSLTKKLYPDNSKHPMPFGILGTTAGTTASNSTIDSLAPNDATFVEINDSDLDHDSAAAAISLNHGIHFSMGAIHEGEKVDGFLGWGTFIDIPEKNSCPLYYGFWGKIGASF